MLVNRGNALSSPQFGQLDMRDDQKMLHQSFDEEKNNDVMLAQLARREVNRDALAA
jgi:hypothetical protein